MFNKTSKFYRLTATRGGKSVTLTFHNTTVAMDAARELRLRGYTVPFAHPAGVLETVDVHVSAASAIEAAALATS